MTVNTLGTDPRLGGGGGSPFAPSSSRGSRTVAEWLWPFCIGGVALFSISAVFYYHFHQDAIAPTSFLQRLYAGLYDAVGLAPSVIFFVLVTAWSTIWLVTGVLNRPASRALRLVAVALLVGVAINLPDAGASTDVHRGWLGAWIAGRLVGGVGYVASLALVWPALFAAVVLATDWFFSEMFERSAGAARAATATEVGVEDEVTERLRSLAEVASAPKSAAEAPKATDERRAIESATTAAPTSTRAAPAAAEPVPEDAAAAAPAEDEATRPLSYAERRRLRALGQDPAEQRPVEGRPVEEGTVDEAPADVEQASAAAGADADSISVDELASLFGEPSAEAPPEIAVDVDEQEADEVPLDYDEPSAEGAGESEDAADEVAADDVATDEVVGVVEEEATDDGESAALEEAEEEEEDEEEDDDEEYDEDEDYEESEDEEELEEEDEEDEESAEYEEESDEEEEEEDDEEEEEGDEDYEDVEYEDEEDESEEDEEDESEEGDEEVSDEEEEEGDEEEEEEEGEYDELDEEEQDEGEEVDEDHEHEVAAELADEQVAEADDVEADDAEVDDLEDTQPEEEPDDAPAETVVAIPRPEEPVEPSLPTPPVDPGSAAQRQQKLFGGGVDEDLVQEAVDVLSRGRRPTAALLQRKLRIDYETASELIAVLEARGIGGGDANA